MGLFIFFLVMVIVLALAFTATGRAGIRWLYRYTVAVAPLPNIWTKSYPGSFGGLIGMLSICSLPPWKMRSPCIRSTGYRQGYDSSSGSVKFFPL